MTEEQKEAIDNLLNAIASAGQWLAEHEAYQRIVDATDAVYETIDE